MLSTVGALAAMILAFQDPVLQENPPPKPLIEIPGEKPFDPRPLFPAGDGLSMRFLAMRPRFELSTREFDVGMFGRKMNFGDLADFDRTAPALDATLNLGNWMFSVTYMRQDGRNRLEEDVTFEQFVFPAGTVIESEALFGTAEIFYRIGLVGAPDQTLDVSLLAGINFSKFRMGMRGDEFGTSEGFSALWPLPALGVQARVSLTDRLSVNLSARGTRIRFENPFQLDGGGSQDVRYLYGRFDGAMEWSLSEHFSVAAGFTGIDAFINNSSSEDTDTASLKAGGISAGVTWRF